MTCGRGVVRNVCSKVISETREFSYFSNCLRFGKVFDRDQMIFAGLNTVRCERVTQVVYFLCAKVAFREVKFQVVGAYAEEALFEVFDM